MVSKEPGLAKPSSPSNSVVKHPVSTDVLAKKKSSLEYDKIRLAQAVAEKAVKENKIFTILGPYPTVRRCMLSRQWVEKVYCMPRKNGSAIPAVASDRDGENVDTTGTKFTVGILKSGRLVLLGYTAAIRRYAESSYFFSEGGVHIPTIDGRPLENMTNMIGRFVKNVQPGLIWTRRRDDVNFKNLQKDQLVNHFPISTFSTKTGLCQCLHKLRWFQDLDADTFFPRCYLIGMEDDRKAFIDDYRLTACLGILKWVVHHVQTSLPKHCKRSQEVDHIPARAAELALQYCEAFIKFKKHEDIDFEETCAFTEKQWRMLIEWYYKLVNEGALLSKASSMYEQCFTMLIHIKPYWPQIEMDGISNIWIIKPGAKSRGIGIKIMQRLEDILNAVECGENVKTDRFIVQKYIERPLLIHNTKFDIRQWFLVTDWNPLTLFFYRDCYIRFCSKQFSLTDRSIAGHLCNNSIQRNYIQNNSKSCFIPDEFMWTYDEFKSFLQQKGKRNVWDRVIYPGMKNAIIATLVSSQDNADYKKGCFELYGADFMLTEDYQPWLIEINSSPCLAPTTKVTGKLCPCVIEDTLKVVVDRRDNKNCPIGKFELVYKQVPFVIPHYVGVNLTVQGLAAIKATSSKGDDDMNVDVTGSSSSKILMENKSTKDEESKELHPLRIKFNPPIGLRNQLLKGIDKPLIDLVRINKITAVKPSKTCKGSKLNEKDDMQISGVAIKMQFKDEVHSKSSTHSSLLHHKDVSPVSEAYRIRNAMTASVITPKKTKEIDAKDELPKASLLLTNIGKTTQQASPIPMNKWVLDTQHICNPDSKMDDIQTLLLSSPVLSSPTSLIQNPWSNFMPMTTSSARQIATKSYSSNLLWADLYNSPGSPFNRSSIKIMPLWSGGFSCAVASATKSIFPSFKAKKADPESSHKKTVVPVKNS